MAYQSVNPYDEHLLQTFKSTTDHEVELALKNASEFYQFAKTQDIERRSEKLIALAKELRSNCDYYAKFLTTNMGKLFSEAQEEVQKTADFAEYYAKNGIDALRDSEITDESGVKARIKYQSIGAVLMVEPWNFPYTQVMRVFAPNFMVGNPVLLKGPSITPECSHAFEAATLKAGFPTGSFKNLFIDYKQVEQLIADPRVQGVAVTGSDAVGRHIAQLAGAQLKKNTMELGGTDVFVVLDDADVNKAIKVGAHARLQNAGQVCTAAKRFIVHEKVYDKFLAGLSHEFEQRVLGNPLLPTTTLAPLSSKKAQEKLQQQVDLAIIGGAEVLWDSTIPYEGSGAGFNPLIISGMKPDNPMYDQELFGPVAQIYKVATDEEVIELANASNHGLGGTIFSRNLERANAIAEQIETGQIAINQLLTSYPSLPFGGVKLSGYGRELGGLGMREFVNAKTIIEG